MAASIRAIEPSVLTSAAVCRSPIDPCSAIAVSVMARPDPEVPAPLVVEQRPEDARVLDDAVPVHSYPRGT